MRRVLRWSLGTVVALVLVTVAAFKFSPWPSVALITYAFSKGDDASAGALAQHVPPGIIEQPVLPHEYQFNLDDPAGVLALHRMLAFLSAVRTAPRRPLTHSLSTRTAMHLDFIPGGGRSAAQRQADSTRIVR